MSSVERDIRWFLQEEHPPQTLVAIVHAYIRSFGQLPSTTQALVDVLHMILVTVQYVTWSVGDHQGNFCVLCQYPIEPDSIVIQLRCGHVFHDCCESLSILSWLHEHRRCPICRMKIKTKTIKNGDPS